MALVMPPFILAAKGSLVRIANEYLHNPAYAKAIRVTDTRPLVLTKLGKYILTNSIQFMNTSICPLKHMAS